MNRDSYIAHLVALALCSMTASSPSASLRQTGATRDDGIAYGQASEGISGVRPNVLFICVDDLNDWVGVLGGHPQTHTPNIDRLAARGTLFTNAHCPSPLCNPSRSAVLTGIPAHRSGVYMNEQPFRMAVPDAVTLPQCFRKDGYSVMGAGKVFHNSIPDADSWDTYFPSLLQQRPHEKAAGVEKAHGIADLGLLNWGPIPGGDALMGDTQVADWVASQLTRDHERPFFLACGLYRTHWPWYVPEGYFERLPGDVELPEVPPERDLDDVPEAGRLLAGFKDYHPSITRNGLWSEAVRGYLAAVSFVDASVGRVLDALDASAHATNTIIVFWSDSGLHLGEKEHWGKYTLWEESTRVPLILAGPGIPSNVRTHAAVGLIDLYPTLSELCGLSPPTDISGASLAPLLRRTAETRERPVLTTHLRGNHSLRTDRWRYVHYRDGTEELYDLENDPHEWRNVAEDESLSEVKAELARWLPDVDAEPAPRIPSSEAKRDLLDEKRRRRHERLTKGKGARADDE